MRKRPILKLKLSKTDTIIEAVSWSSLVLLWVITIFNYTNLPDIIPIHYNAAGKVDGYGHKTELIILPIIGTIIFIAITILNKFPHIFNYLVEITEENALSQYQFATRMLRILKLVIIIIFITITLLTIDVSITNGNEINFWLLPIIISTLFITTALYIYKSIKKQSA